MLLFLWCPDRENFKFTPHSWCSWDFLVVLDFENLWKKNDNLAVFRVNALDSISVCCCVPRTDFAILSELYHEEGAVLFGREVRRLKVSKCNKPLVGLRGSQSLVERPNWCQENLSLVLRDPTDVKKQLCLQASAACLFHHSAQIYPAEDMRFSWRSDRVSSWASPNLRERRGRAS